MFLQVEKLTKLTVMNLVKCSIYHRNALYLLESRSNQVNPRITFIHITFTEGKCLGSAQWKLSQQLFAFQKSFLKSGEGRLVPGEPFCGVTGISISKLRGGFESNVDS